MQLINIYLHEITTYRDKVLLNTKHAYLFTYICVCKYVCIYVNIQI